MVDEIDVTRPKPYSVFQCQFPGRMSAPSSKPRATKSRTTSWKSLPESCAGSAAANAPEDETPIPRRLRSKTRYRRRLCLPPLQNERRGDRRSRASNAISASSEDAAFDGCEEVRARFAELRQKVDHDSLAAFFVRIDCMMLAPCFAVLADRCAYSRARLAG